MGRHSIRSLAASVPVALALSWDSLLVLMRNGNAYVNVHSVRYPAGVVRGQVQVQ